MTSQAVRVTLREQARFVIAIYLSTWEGDVRLAPNDAIGRLLRNRQGSSSDPLRPPGPGAGVDVVGVPRRSPSRQGDVRIES